MVSFLGVVFAVVSFLGLVLVFVIVGGSLMFLVFGYGFGVVVVMINILISVLENRSNSVVRDRVRRLVFFLAIGENEVLGGINLFEVRVVDLFIK